MERLVAVPVGDVTLGGDLALPAGARGVVVLTHGRGSSRASAMNRYVAGILRHAGFATLLLDLLTIEEEAGATRRRDVDVALLSARLVGATDWLGSRASMRLLPVGYFGVDAAGAGALVAAGARPHLVRAVVTWAARADLAGAALHDVTAVTLLIVGTRDARLVEANRVAAAAIRGGVAVEVVPDAAGLGTEPGAFERVAALARRWFESHLGTAGVRRAG